MNKRTVGLEITAGHLQINEADVVAKNISKNIPSKVMNDGIVNSLNTKVGYTTSLGAQPDRIFATFTFTSPMLPTDFDIYDWLEEADVSRRNVVLYSNPDEIVQELKNADGIGEKREILESYSGK